MMTTAGTSIATLVDTVLDRARQEPERAVYHLVAPADGPTTHVTAASLSRACRAVAQRLRERHEPGERVLLLLPAGAPFVVGFLACAFAGLTAVPAAPPSRTRVRQSLPPLLRVAADALPHGVVTTAAIAATIPAELPDDAPIGGLPWHAIEELGHGDGEAWEPPRTEDDPIAFVQYTSGSTADPRGVVVRRSNLLANLATINRAFATTADDHAVVWLPPHHDMGLVGGLLTPLTGGFEVTLLQPQDFVQAPSRWLRAISDAGGTISGGPDFGYRLCVERARSDQLEAADLGSWRLAFTGAEPISVSTLDGFVERFGPLGFDPSAWYPCYGLAESTLIVTGGVAGGGAGRIRVSRSSLDATGRAVPAVTDDDERWLVGNGGALGPGTTVVIVDPTTSAPCPDGLVGEIWVAGPSVADGYHDQPEATAATFGATTTHGSGPYLRTGDLGFVVEGVLYVTGRSKDVIAVNGRNLDAHDIEAAVAEVVDAPRAGQCAALGVLTDDRERLVILQEVGRLDPSTADALVRHIRAAVADRTGVRPDDVVLVGVGALPRTTSGKLKRAEAARQFAAGTFTQPRRRTL